MPNMITEFLYVVSFHIMDYLILWCYDDNKTLNKAARFCKRIPNTLPVFFFLYLLEILIKHYQQNKFNFFLWNDRAPIYNL